MSVRNLLTTLLLPLLSCCTVSDVPPPPPAPVIESPPHPVSLRALMEKEYDGRDLTLGTVLEKNAAYTRHTITYKSGDLTISGILNIPAGPGPFPVLILNHGYIDVSVYTNGRGLKREQDYFARRGYAVLHPDYRNHAFSDKDPLSEVNLRIGYVEDVINAVYAVRASSIPQLDGTRVGMLGHSMGGGITTNILVSQPPLVKAAVLFAPVSADMRKNYDRWLKDRPEVTRAVAAIYGTPEKNPAFWDAVSAQNYLDRIEVPVLLHHGDADADVPVEWSRELHDGMKTAGVDVTYHEYPGEGHEFSGAWATVMKRSVEFFDGVLK